MKQLLTISLVLAASGPAAAQTPHEGPQTVLPGIPNLRSGTTLDARLDATRIDAFANDATFVATNLSFQHISPSGFGGYVQVPFGYISADGVDSNTALGNVELGALFVNRVNPHTQFFLRGGVTLNTADDEGEIIVPLTNFVSRPGDA